MKKLLTLLYAGCLINAGHLGATTNAKSNKGKDTISIRCMLFSPNLFYGIELGEKPVRDMVDTLVSEIPSYDTASELNLVIVSARELGFKGYKNILWEDILDSAESRGYEICPPQVGPELYVLSQNMPHGKALLNQKVANGRPIFIGMDRIRHNIIGQKNGGFAFLKRKNHFDYVFCIKSSPKRHSYELGYSATNTATQDEDFTWSTDDMFIFIKSQHPKSRKAYYCGN